MGTSTAAAVVGRRRRSPAGARHWRELAAGYLFSTPSLLVFSVFMFLPIALVFYYSLLDKPSYGPSKWVGLGNFRALVDDPVFRRSFLNTVGYAAVMVPSTLAAGLAVALLLNRKMPGRNLFRTAYFFPVVVSTLAGGVAAGWVFNEQIGLANKLAGYVGLGPYHWASDPTYAVITVILVGLWQQTGFAMIVYLAALQNVDGELYDASAVDGATPARQLRYVTLPAIRPATAFISVMSVITSFHVFDIVFVLTAGGPGNTTMTVGLYSYQEAFTTQRQGYGSAIAVVLFLMIVLATLTQWAFASRRRAR